MNGWAAETLRWIVGLFLAGVVSYFTTIASMDAKISVLEERVYNYQAEVIRRLERIERKMDDQRDYGFQFGSPPERLRP